MNMQISLTITICHSLWIFWQFATTTFSSYMLGFHPLPVYKLHTIYINTNNDYIWLTCTNARLMLTNNTTHLLPSIRSWDLQTRNNTHQFIYKKPHHWQKKKKKKKKKHECNTTAITELHDSCSRLPLSLYNTLTLTSQLLNTTPRGITKQNLTTVKTPLMWWFSRCLLFLIFFFLPPTMREEKKLYHCYASHYTNKFDTWHLQTSMLHYSLSLLLLLFMGFPFPCNYNDKTLHLIMHNTMSHLSYISWE